MMLVPYALKAVFFVLMLSFTTSLAAAEAPTRNQARELVIKDYGVHGHLFEIREQSILEEIMEKLLLAVKEGKLEQLQKEFTEKVKARVLRPLPVANLKKAQTNRSWTYDPTYTQRADITDDQGRVIVAAGSTVNALEKLKWGEPLILIDGEDEEQIEWAKSRQGKIVLTNGAPLEIGDKLKRPVYFDQGGIFCRRFKIEAMPAKIEQDGLLLKVSEVKI